MEYPFIAFTPRSSQSRSILSIGQIELFEIQTKRKQMTDAKLNC